MKLLGEINKLMHEGKMQYFVYYISPPMCKLILFRNITKTWLKHEEEERIV